MRSLPKIERILMGIGLCIFVCALYLFLFETTRISHLLGYGDDAKRMIVGKVTAVQNTSRRRLYGAADFSPLLEKQAVFSRDLLTTGKDSGLVFQLSDGSVIELGPDSMVELKMKDESHPFEGAEFVLDLKQGSASGNSSNGKAVTVLNQGKEVPLPPSQPNSLLTTVQEKKPNLNQTTSPSECQLLDVEIKNPGLSRDLSAHVMGKATCGSGITEFTYKIKNAAGEVVASASHPIGTQSIMSYEFVAKHPGDYLIEIKDTNQPKVINIQKEFEGLKLIDAPLKCDNGVGIEPMDLKQVQSVALIDHSRNSKIRESANQFYFKHLSDFLPAPAQIRFQTQLKNGFVLTSATKVVRAWRECPSLQYPKNGIKMPYQADKTVLFTWAKGKPDDEFLFELADNPQFERRYFEKVSRNFMKLLLKHRGDYYWRVTLLRSQEVSEVFKLHME